MMSVEVKVADTKEDMATAEEEGEESSGDDEDEELGEESSQKAKQALLGRKVTLSTLIDDGIIEPGQGFLSIDYLGQRFEADLLENGKIRWHGSDIEFATPTAWALHCKRLVNPHRRSGCGWASVKYKGKKLFVWRSAWQRKQRSPFKSPHQSASASQSLLTSGLPTFSLAAASSVSANNLQTSENSSHLTTTSSKSLSSLLSTPIVDPQTLLSTPVSASDQPSRHPFSAGMDECKKTTSYPNSPSSGMTKVSTHSHRSPDKESDHSAVAKDNIQRERKCIRYSDLNHRTSEIDMNTLVHCETFESHQQLQPFKVVVSTNALLLVDFHCHLTRSEVVGYLGGHWDGSKQILTIEQAFPVLCRFMDKLQAPVVEEEIRRRMKTRKLTLVGWYHSHPYCKPQPSLRDVDTQMAYQLQMRAVGASTYHPCIGLIESPWEKSGNALQAYWVMPNLEHPTSFNIPMHIAHAVHRDLSLTEDVLIDTKLLSEFYSGSPDRISFKEHWKGDTSFLDTIRASLASKLPEDQLESGTFLDYTQQLLKEMK